MKNANISFYRSALRSSTVLVAAAAIAAPAFAQDQDAQDTQETAEEVIVVTGSLIANPNIVSSSPVNVVGAEEVSLRQANTAEQLLREIPGVIPNLGQNVNNGTVGSARIDLRGFGSKRNIVLLDSVRLAPSNFVGAVDLNNIPLALVDRVDVLTGGASTSYGADAVTGVVNFITKRDFAGLDLTVSEQLSEKGDANVFRTDLVIGANFDDGRGNAVFAVGYQESDPLYFSQRGFGEFVLSSISGNASGDSFTSVPSGVSFPTGDFQVSPDGSSLVPFYNTFNFNPYNVYQIPFERFNMFGQARYEISDRVEVYTRGLFSKNTVSSIIAPSGVFGEELTIPGNNPFLNATIRDQLCALNGLPTGAACAANPAIPLPAVYRRSVELGPRVSEYVTNYFDYQAGIRFDVTDRIKLDVYGAYGESEIRETRSGYVARSRLQQALNASDPTTCDDPSNGCVPLNLWGPAGSITPEMAGFIGGITSTINQKASLAQAHGLLSGDFGWSLPWTDNPVAFAVGAEYRDYSAERNPDNLAQVPGELGGAGGAITPLSGGFDVREVFGELIAPIASDQPFFYDLSVEAGIRYSKYRVDAAGDPKFNATTYKFGVNWSPVSALKLRGNYQRAVRAPNIGELFAPVSTGLTNLAVDPCAGAAPVGNANLTLACLNQGAPLASIGLIQNPIAGQANATGGGNPALKPEKAKTWTIGAVLQPEGALSGLTVSLDYYNLRVTDAITTALPGDVIAACFGSNPAAITAAQANSVACTSIRRNQSNGRLSGSPANTPGLPLPLTNAGRLKTEGFDLQVNYKRDLGFAELTWNFSGNYTLNSAFAASSTTPFRECTGFYSANCGIALGQIQPEFSWNQRTTLSWDNVDVSLLWRHLDSAKYEPGLPPLFDGVVTGRGPLVGKDLNFNKISAYDYFDLTARFSLTDNLEITLSAFNIFDKKPPIVGANAGTTSANSGNTFPSTYDVVGRRYAATARLKF